MNLKNKNLIKDKAFINGQWVKAPKSFDVKNPANDEVITSVPDMGGDDTRDAIGMAKEAMVGWAAMTAKERAAILKKWNDLILENADDLAAILTAEMGKPLAESKGEVLYGASFIEWFAEEGKRAYGDIIPSPIKGARILVEKQPVGVCGMITPWNFPSAMITRKAAPALAAGCSVVLKPAAETPLSALALAVLAEEAGFPEGVFNVLTSSDAASVGEEMCSNATVRKVSFTGSTAVGKILMKQCASTVKKLSLELGGNAPFIVFDDADIEAAVDGAIACKYRNAGQTCVCANRIYVHEAIYDDFAQRLAKKVEDMKVGAGDEDKVEIGPLINMEAVEKVEAHIADAKDNGAKVVTGGARHSKGGTFFEPTVLTGVTSKMKVAGEETFGPVAPLFKFSDTDDVIKQANDTQYGLASYFYAKDMAKIIKVAEALEYGMVAVNTPILSTEVAPFGGIKESGLGREGSKYGLDDYLEIKYILLSGLEN